MVLAWELTIAGEAHPTFVLPPNALYLLPDRSLAPVHSDLVWCHACDGFRAGEFIEPRQFVQSQLAQIAEGELPEYFRFIYQEDASLWARHCDSLRRRLHWMTLRRAPPKCLDCGGLEISPVTSPPGDELADRLGRVVKCSQVLASTSIDHLLSLYTAEGDLLGEISRICPETTDFIDDGYGYDRVVDMLDRQSERDR